MENRITAEKFAVLWLVDKGYQPSAQLGQEGGFEYLVFQNDGVEGYRRALTSIVILHSIRQDTVAGFPAQEATLLIRQGGVDSNEPIRIPVPKVGEGVIIPQADTRHGKRFEP